MTTLFFDQIDKLKLELQEELLQYGKLDTQECIDAVEEILILAFVYGVEDVNKMLGIEDTPKASRLKTAIEKKYDGKDFIDRIREYAQNGDIEAIGVVAETDAHRMYNDAAFGVAVDNGATTKTWVAVIDERTRYDHVGFDGVTLPIDTPFVALDGDYGQFPGDFQTAAQNANCRCVCTFSK